jgi:hypothetical protein
MVDFAERRNEAEGASDGKAWRIRLGVSPL